MNPENKKRGVGRMLVGMGLGIVLAILSPVLMMTEALSLTVVLMLPSIALVALNRWAGKAATLSSAMMQMCFSAMLLDGACMWMAFFLTLMPAALVIHYENKPFAVQMKASIAAFGTGVVLAVLAAYFVYGKNLIEQVLNRLPQMLRSLPADSMETVMKTYSDLFGRVMSTDDFYHAFDQMIYALTPVYRLNLPGLIFSGALISAVLCVGLNGLMRRKQGIATEETVRPLREWALPASVTGGILLMLAVSFVLDAVNFPQGETVFYTVYDIAVAVFCIHALASMARRLHVSPLKHGIKVGIIAVIAVLCLMGASMYVSIYGIASAVFGTKGLLRQRMINKKNDGHSNENE